MTGCAVQSEITWTWNKRPRKSPVSLISSLFIYWSELACSLSVLKIGEISYKWVALLPFNPSFILCRFLRVIALDTLETAPLKPNRRTVMNHEPGSRVHNICYVWWIVSEHGPTKHEYNISRSWDSSHPYSDGRPGVRFPTRERSL